ncbi:peroxidase family protein [Dichotomicrobium thermohalophilum]|uniref:Heme peroxidase n=1 Tax=Dichotomicrobium thermohalophilum TaxID=933063 RepID=A0A397PFG2_9HYPH|nr:peroxidase family protein [Dichotomicrobium thermohalophilum]RIA47698.1 heme peroxidase [Dichotomicrobium thermohalophilum]
MKTLGKGNQDVFAYMAKLFADEIETFHRDVDKRATRADKDEKSENLRFDYGSKTHDSRDDHDNNAYDKIGRWDSLPHWQPQKPDFDKPDFHKPPFHIPGWPFDDPDDKPDKDPDTPPDQSGDPHEALRDLEMRSMDGSGNNDAYENWGAADSQFLRLTKAYYEYHGDSTEPLEPRTNYRALSNDVIKQDAPIENSFGVNDLFTFFGQFIDHDIDIAAEGTEEGPYIIAPEDEPNPNFVGAKLGIESSTKVDGTGSDASNPPQHANGITSFVDASSVYGSDQATLASLRDTDKPWLLATSAGGDLLPIGDSPRDQFQAGDVRAGENSALTSMHTIWVKEHNRIAEELRTKFPDWSADDIFDATKIKVEALMQHIVFDEWLPLLVGAENIPEYGGYDPTINAGISHEFATAAFRLGHSLLSSQVLRTRENGDSAGDLALSQMFFNAAILKDAGSVDTLVRGIAEQTAQEIDQHLVEDVRSLLFPSPGGVQVRDLSVLNHLRGLDHGLGTLNEVRDELGLGKHQSFLDLTGGNRDLADALAGHYDTVDDVDLWIGGLIEEPVEGSQLGESFQTIVVDQFVRLRDGDSYYFEKRLADNPLLLDEIKQTSFSEIIKRNTDIAYLQDDAFIAHDRIGGDDHDDFLVGTSSHDLVIGFEGNDRLMGRQGDDDIYGSEGHDRMYGGLGDDLMNGGHGNDVMFGGFGSDTFVFEQGSGHDKVIGFGRHDKLDLSDYGFSSVDEVKTASTHKRGGTTIELSENGDKVELVGVKLWRLDEDNFILDQDSDGLYV